MTKTPLDHNGSEVFLYGMHLHLGDHVFINYGADFLGKRENDFTILVGREYDFTESGGTGVISSDAAFFCLTVNLTVFHADRLGSGAQLIDARLGDL